MISSLILFIELLAIYVAYVVLKTVRSRWMLRDLPTLGPHHPVWGSLKVIKEMKKHIPPDTHPGCWILYLKEHYSLGKIVYVDFAPVRKPEIWILDPDLANEVTITHSLPKSSDLPNYFLPISGKQAMAQLEGPAWKRLRSLFNPGFSAKHLMSLTPMIVKQTLVFREIIQERARVGTRFLLEETVARLTIDCIARAVLPTEFYAQTTDNEYAALFRAQAQELGTPGSFNPFVKYNFARRRRLAERQKQMSGYIGRILDDHYERRKKGIVEDETKTIVDIALDLYEKDFAESKDGQTRLDPAFRTLAIDNFKSFLFAGHDTTSGTIAYTLYLLHEHPESFAKMAQELDIVLGLTLEESVMKINSEPHVLNNLAFTHAVIKETLRLYPPGGTRRDSKTTPDFKIRDRKTGEEWPTFGWTVMPRPVAIQRDSSNFPCPDEFIPERFLPEQSPFPPFHKDAWLPFSKGPRNCIGQDLAMKQMLIILALTTRDFDFFPDYPPVRKARAEKVTLPGQGRAYQVLSASGKPKDNMPGRMRFRTRAE